MNKVEIVKKLCEILETSVDGLVPKLKKLKDDIEEQEKEIKKLKKKI